MSTPDDIRREARKAARVPTGAAGAGVFVPGVGAAEGDIDHQRDTSGNSFPLQSTDFTLERLECSGVFELWSAPALGHSTHSTALTECVECSGDLEYFYMSNSPTGTYPIAILCTHVHSIARISKKYNSENDTYDIYGCIASVENIVKPYLSVFTNLVPPDK